MARASAIVVVLTSVCGIGLVAQSPDKAAGVLQGAWRVTEVTTTGPAGRNIRDHRPGFLLVTGKHLALMVEAGDKPRPADPPTTYEQLRQVWGPLVAFSGTYEVSAKELTVHIAVHKVPANMQPGSFMTWSYVIEGNTLTLVTVRTHEGPSKNPITWTLTRVE